MTILGLDAAAHSLADADHLAHDLVARLGLGETTVACTHLIRGHSPHVALSFDVSEPTDLTGQLATLVHSGDIGVVWGEHRLGPADLNAGAAQAVAAHTARTSGRAVIYPGASALTGTVTAGLILTSSAIGRVVVLAGATPPNESDLIHTRDHVRPDWQAGVLTLTTTPVAPGEYAPFEVPNPTPCCADHH